MAAIRPARIIMLIDSLGMGGAERLLVTYLRHLDRSQFDVRVCPGMSVMATRWRTRYAG